MNPRTIDLNCDMGESYGRFIIGNDADLMPLITSCNIACGFHGGDPLHLEHTLRLAQRHGVRIGAHPSYPDLQGFGRRRMEIPADELRAIIKYQIAALRGLAASVGAVVHYVKPHGALYNSAAENAGEAAAVVRAIREMGGLFLLAPAGSRLEAAAHEQGVPFVAEAFADRRYRPDGSLAPRSEPGAVIAEPEAAALQAVALATHGTATAISGETVTIRTESLCIHGDNPAAPELLRAIRAALAAAGLTVAAKVPA